MKVPTPKEYLEEHAPDIAIINTESPTHGALKDFDTSVFGEELSERADDLIGFTMEWLSSPLVTDEADSDTVRMHREDTFPEEVVALLKKNRLHPSAIQRVVISLGTILDYDRRLELGLFNQDHFGALSEITEQFRIFTCLRNHLNDTNTMVWQSVLSVLEGNEMDELIKAPHVFINNKLKELSHKIEAIAFDILQSLEKKG